MAIGAITMQEGMVIFNEFILLNTVKLICQVYEKELLVIIHTLKA